MVDLFKGVSSIRENQGTLFFSGKSGNEIFFCRGAGKVREFCPQVNYVSAQFKCTFFSKQIFALLCSAFLNKICAVKSMKVREKLYGKVRGFLDLAAGNPDSIMGHDIDITDT